MYRYSFTNVQYRPLFYSSMHLLEFSRPNYPRFFLDLSICGMGRVWAGLKKKVGSLRPKNTAMTVPLGEAGLLSGPGLPDPRRATCAIYSVKHQKYILG